MRLRLTLVLALLLAVPAAAHAQPLDAGGELSTLELELQNDALQADTSDCSTACRALDSMRRAAERICKIDAGEPCLKARDKVARSEQRVRAACPDCTPAPRQEEREAAKEATPAPPEAAPAAAAPQRGRGCAGCATTGRDDAGPAGAALLALAALAVAAARARRRR